MTDLVFCHYYLSGVILSLQTDLTDSPTLLCPVISILFLQSDFLTLPGLILSLWTGLILSVLIDPVLSTLIGFIFSPLGSHYVYTEMKLGEI